MKESNIVRRLIAGQHVVLLLFGISATIAQASEDVTDQALSSDLRSVIILAGYPCHRIESIGHPNSADYHVTCDIDRHYRVHVSEEKEIVVERRAKPPRASAAEVDHEEFMRRQLFAIVNLAGHECPRVVDYEQHGSRESIVTCEGQLVYRISVTAEGRVKVEKHEAGK